MANFKLPLPNPALTGTALFWSANFVALDILLREVPTAAATLIRFLIMAPMLVIYAWIVKVPIRYANRADMGRLMLIGALTNGVYMIIFYYGIEQSSPTVSAICLSTIPLMTALIAAARRIEPITIQLIGALILASIGVTVVAVGGRGSVEATWAGVALLLLAALNWAIVTVMTQPLTKTYSPQAILTLGMPGALAVLIPFGIIPTVRLDYSAVSLQSWAAMGYVVVFGGALAIAFFYKGIQQVGPGRATYVQYFLPPLTAVISWLILGLPPKPLQWIGMVIVVGAVILASKRPKAITS